MTNQAGPDGMPAGMDAPLAIGENIVHIPAHIRICFENNMVVPKADILPVTAMVTGIKNVWAKRIVSKADGAIASGGLRMRRSNWLARGRPAAENSPAKTAHGKAAPYTREA